MNIIIKNEFYIIVNTFILFNVIIVLFKLNGVSNVEWNMVVYHIVADACILFVLALFKIIFVLIMRAKYND